MGCATSSNRPVSASDITEAITNKHTLSKTQCHSIYEQYRDVARPVERWIRHNPHLRCKQLHTIPTTEEITPGSHGRLGSCHGAIYAFCLRSSLTPYLLFECDNANYSASVRLLWFYMTSDVVHQMEMVTVVSDCECVLCTQFVWVRSITLSDIR